MAIEFRCSQCNQLLRVPEEAAGKSARCPKCQALMTVPGIATALPSPSESPPFSDAAAPSLPPLLGSSDLPAPPPSFPTSVNPFAGEQPASAPQPPPPKRSGDNPFAAVATAPPPDSLNPYASPAAADHLYAQQYFYGGPRPGLPWEYEPRTIGCWFRTMGIVLGSPTRAFSMMRQYGGLGAPIFYNLYAVGMLIGLATVILVPIGLIVAFAAGPKNNNQGEILAGIATIGVIGIFVAAFYAVILTVVMPFMWSAILHLMLMLFGGARYGFETTFRVVCFAYFSALVPGVFIAIVPYLGGIALGIWVMVLIIIGFSRAHETSGGKAAAAVLAPPAVCCGLYIAIVAIVVTVGLSGAFKG